jgi:aromatic ring-opening dioxygenase catalytic subunit (LigB family)
MSEDENAGVTRRQVVAAAVAGAAMSALPGCEAPAAQANPQPQRRPAGGARTPAVYLPHGGGPWPFVDLGFGTQGEKEALLTYLRSVRTLTATPPRALLVVSAHWEEDVATLMTAARPPLLFDYYGFPEESYRLTWPAPGAPELAPRVRALLTAGGFATREDPNRGYDHGTFVPLKVTWPEADVPVLQLSLKTGLNPAEHLAMGRALAPLRDEGVVIVGSGMSYHNMRGFGGRGREASERFDAWLRETVAMEAQPRDERLRRWTEAPSAREVHPREEHLLPLMVIAGAAGDDRGRVPYNGTFAGVRLSAVQFG